MLDLRGPLNDSDVGTPGLQAGGTDRQADSVNGFSIEAGSLLWASEQYTLPFIRFIRREDIQLEEFTFSDFHYKRLTDAKVGQLTAPRRWHHLES